MMPWQYMVADSIIRKILLDEKPDMVEITDKYTLSIFGTMVRRKGFQQLGRPMLVHFSCERMDDNIASFVTKSGWGKWLARRVIGNYTLPSFDYHIANSAYTAGEFYDALSPAKNKGRSKRFLNWCWKFFKAPMVPPDTRIAVCPRGVDATQFNPERRSDDVKRELRMRADIPADSTVMLYAGRISPEKNIELLVEMMKQLANDPRDFRLVVAGAGPQSEWLQEQTDSHFPGKIVQLGHLDKETLSNYYANADVFVHPNPREPFGIAPLEAMASGVPTVAPNGGGILSYATNDNIWLVEPEGEAFAAAVREVIDDPQLREQKVVNALETARANTREASTDNLFSTYDKLYADFQNRFELFTNGEKAAEFNYIEDLLSTEPVPKLKAVIE